MESLRIKKKDIYRIEVNDDGEFIEFDLADIGLGFKLKDALGQIESIIRNTKEKEKRILNSEDKKETGILSSKQKQLIDLEQETFRRCREAMDTFLGQEACQKIFGDRNYYEMFDDLIQELTRPRKELGGKSHLDKLKISSNNIRNRIMNKYSKNKGKTI